jgi:DNA-binding LacI/PurR family transcriptional regulator
MFLLPNWPIGYSVGLLLEDLSVGLAEHGLTMVVHPQGRVSRPVSEIWRAITPAAVVSFDDFTDDDMTAMRAAGIQVTIAVLGGKSRRRRDLEVPQQQASRIQVEHLAGQGHRRIGFAYPDDPRVRTFAVARLDGARQACAELGLYEPLVRVVPLDPAAAADAVRAWRETDPAISAICAYNDEVALAVLAGARRLGLHAPADLAVIGVDDIPSAALAAPPLTTVQIDPGSLADHIVTSVTRALAGQPPLRGRPSAITNLIVRESA